MTKPPIVVAITGASGAPYAVRLLSSLAAAKESVQLIVSSHGLRLLSTEMGIDSIGALRDSVGRAAWDSCVTTFDDADRGASPASGSALNAGMVVCPCSMGTLSAIAAGSSRSLVERAADVALKERRKLILVPRETPLSAIHLENMLKLARLGVRIVPPMPQFYLRPQTADEMVDRMVRRCLAVLGIEEALPPEMRWRGDEE